MEGGQFKRWTASRKLEAVLRIFKGESIDKLSREYGIEVCLLEEWRTKAVEGIELGFKSRTEVPLKQELDQAKKRLGELLMENELLQIKASRAPAFQKGRSKK